MIVQQFVMAEHCTDFKHIAPYVKPNKYGHYWTLCQPIGEQKRNTLITVFTEYEWMARCVAEVLYPYTIGRSTPMIKARYMSRIEAIIDNEEVASTAFDIVLGLKGGQLVTVFSTEQESMFRLFNLVTAHTGIADLENMEREVQRMGLEHYKTNRE